MTHTFFKRQWHIVGWRVHKSLHVCRHITCSKHLEQSHNKNIKPNNHNQRHNQLQTLVSINNQWAYRNSLFHAPLLHACITHWWQMSLSGFIWPVWLELPSHVRSEHIWCNYGCSTRMGATWTMWDGLGFIRWGFYHPWSYHVYR